jgi:hypothetical protein
MTARKEAFEVDGAAGEQIFQVAAKSDHLKRQASTTPLAALAECIWNALDADAALVEVEFHQGPLALERVVIRDDGSGMTRDEAPNLFRNLGDSWKSRAAKTKRKGRFLHGREGRGRFKAFVLGRVADWNVTFLDGDTLKQFAVSVIADDMERGKISEARASTARGTGTELVISEPPHDLRRLRDDDARQALTEILAPYLLSYADVRVSVEGVLLDPPSGFADRTPHPLTPVVVDGATHSVTLDLIEWKRTSERLLFLCGEHGFPLLTLEGRLPASERGFSAYLRSPLIQILHDRNELGVGGLNPTLEAMITEARAAIRDHLRRRAAAEAQNVIQRWKDEAVYPYTEAPTSPLEEVQRQYFDIVATTAARHIDDFDQASQRARRLQLRTLRIAVEQGGEDVQFALQEVLNLPKKELADFVGLLKETSLSAIIGGVKVVSDRLKVLTGLEALISDEDTSASLKERTQLHRLVAENTWLFGEEFHLMADDEGLNRCLVEHARMRDVEVLDMKPVAHPSKKRGIVDLMFGKRRQVYRATDLEHLVVELKAPKVSIKEEQIRQVEGYARAIASDDRFDKVNTRWVFWALSKEIDEEYAQYRRGDLGPSGPVHRRGNLSIWVKTWGALFNENRARLQFYQDALALKITREGALEHLRTTYGRYLEGVLVSPSSDAAGGTAETANTDGTAQEESIQGATSVLH